MNLSFESFKVYFNKEKNLVKICYFIFLIAFVSTGFLLTLNGFENTSKTLTDQMAFKDAKVRDLVSCVPASTTQITNLQNEFDVIQEIKKPYLTMAINATTMWYTATVLFTYASIITAILAFVIGKKGWDNGDPFLKITFLVFAFYATFWGLVPVVFNNKATGKYNLDKFSFFNQQQLLIYDKIKIYQDSTIKPNGKYLDGIIAKIDTSIRANQEFYFDIDQNRVPDSKTMIKSFAP